MKGPSIAVMLGHPAEGESDEAEPGLAESKAGEKDAAKALISAVASKDPEAVVRAFRAMSTLCHESSELEESGEEESKDEGSDDEG